MPSLPIFIQMVLGIACVKFWNLRGGVIFCLILLLTGILGHCLWGIKWKRIIYSWCFMGTVALLTFWRMEKSLTCEWTQIWKLSYAIEIIKIDQKPSRGKVYGYGIIKNISGKKYKFLEGHKIYFYFNGNGDYIPSQIVGVRSGIRLLKPHCSETFFSYLVQKNIYLYGYCGEVLEILEEAKPAQTFFATINRHLRDRVASYAQKHGNHPSDGILYGLLLSEKKELSKEQKDNFHNTGAAHLLAVSGLHIGMIGFALDFLLHCFFLGKNWRRMPILIILFLYVGAIGFPPSAVRAWLMITCHWSAGLFRRSTSGIDSLLNAAILSLIYEPLLLFDIGFQLSYGVVAMLLLLSLPLQDLLLCFFRHTGWGNILRKENRATKKAYILRKGVELFSVSVAATLASAPLTFEYFNMFSFSGILLNPVVIQMALPTVVCGFLFLLTGLLNVEGWLSDCLFFGARWGVAWIDCVLLWAEKYIPWHMNFPVKPDGFGILLFIIFLILAIITYFIHQKLQRMAQMMK
ncbi:MAG: ComEC/Rec2 family competence protein [Puniceicoccales bacterium]|jgi:ComEC/Rec2-related protein|nr:ComEC/Rec2 family competence protein [Puniceicoccales bacterium]